MSHAEKLKQFEEARDVGAEALAARQGQLREIEDKIGRLDTERRGLLKRAADGDATAHKTIDKLSRDFEILDRARQATEAECKKLDFELGDVQRRIDEERRLAEEEERVRRGADLKEKREAAARAWDQAQRRERTASAEYEEALLQEQIFAENNRVATVR